MYLKKIAQGTALFMFSISLQGTNAYSKSLEWEGFDDEQENSLEGNDRMQLPSEGVESAEAYEVVLPDVQVIAPGQKPIAVRAAHRKFTTTHVPANAAGIKDETATTGENAKKRPPQSVRPAEVTPSPYLHDINQTMPFFMLAGSQSDLE